MNAPAELKTIGNATQQSPPWDAPQVSRYIRDAII